MKIKVNYHVHLGWIGMIFLVVSCHNPFAPPLADSETENNFQNISLNTIDGFFSAFQLAYTFRDSTQYGKLLHSNFMFVYRDFDRGVDDFWGREQDMKTTFGLFVNSEQLDLTWNFFRDYQIDSLEANISRAFKLRVVFSSTDILTGEGNVRFRLIRPTAKSDWKLIRWTDESNF